MTSSPAAEPAPAVTVADIEAAARRLEGLAARTPLLESPLLDEMLGARLLLKAEPLQRTGSFKFRGAYNRISMLSEAERRRGVVAFSSGNHAQGVAHAARLLGAPAVIVMPSDAPAIKIANTRAYGAEVVLYDRRRESREAIGARISAERGLALVRPYDDPGVIAGQGTVGLEIVSQCAERGLIPDVVAASASGGGLVAGVATAVKSRLPTAAVYCAEPEGFDDHARSLAAGRRVGHAEGSETLCDALMAPTPGEITFAINRRLLAGGLVADETAVKRAMSVAFRHFKVVVEPGGACALAAVLHGLEAKDNRFTGRTVAVVASGGNVDPAAYAGLLASA